MVQLRLVYLNTHFFLLMFEEEIARICKDLETTCETQLHATSNDIESFTLPFSVYIHAH